MTCAVGNLLFILMHIRAAKNDSNEGRDWAGLMNAIFLNLQTATNGLDYSSDIVRDYEVVIYTEG